MKEEDKKERLLTLSASYVDPGWVSLMKSFMVRIIGTYSVANLMHMHGFGYPSDRREKLRGEKKKDKKKVKENCQFNTEESGKL